MTKQEATKVDLYFRECTQEIMTLPITVPNCYYLGSFDVEDRFKIKDLLDNTPHSFKQLSIKIKALSYRRIENV